MTLRAPVDISAPRPQPPSHRRRLMVAVGSSMLPLTLRGGVARQRAAGGRVACRGVPVAAPVAEEGEVLHVLARRHGGNTLELELHGGNLLKHLRLRGARAGRVSTRTGTQHSACHRRAQGRRRAPPGAGVCLSPALCAARGVWRASLSGGISQLRSQSQAPLPSDTAPTPTPADAAVMPSSLASPLIARDGGRTLRGVEAPKRRTEEKPRHAGYLTRCPWRLHPNRTPSPTSTHATAAPRPPPQIPPLASAFARRVGSASVVGTGATSWAAGCGLARRGAGACCQQTILCNLQHESRRGAPAALTSSANAPGYWGRHGGAGAGVARRR